MKVSHAINEKKIEMNLCKSCAEDKGFNNPLFNLPQLFENFIAELIGQEMLKSRRRGTEEKCPGCGSTWDDFHQTGLLGCDICYLTYEDDLNVILRRIHGSNKHIGSRPKSHRYNVDASELEGIRKQLDKAIKDENFERAAELRDIIRDAQHEIEKRKDDGILR
ncbi:MAG: UvrB/UvrC motif-containing protein [bacterium]